MSTRSGTKRARTEQKGSQQPAKRLAIAQSLPASLLLHLMRFLDDSRTLSRMQSVCRNWNSFSSHQLDLCWRALYLHDWEAESATDASILTSGESTPWKDRVRRRVEANWNTGQGTERHIILPNPAWCVVISPTFIAVGLDQGTVMLFDHQGHELRSWKPDTFAICSMH